MNKRIRKKHNLLRVSGIRHRLVTHIQIGYTKYEGYVLEICRTNLNKERTKREV